jgi:uncharacterized protein (TIGR02246 family)
MTRWIIAAAAALCLAGSPVATLAHPVEQSSVAATEASAVVERFHAAMAAGDAAAVAALMAEDAVIYEEGYVERSKAEYVAHHLTSDIAFMKTVASATTARSEFAVGDLAYVISEGTTKGTYNGKPVDRISLETMVLKRGPDGWRIAHIHWSSRKPAS